MAELQQNSFRLFQFITIYTLLSVSSCLLMRFCKLLFCLMQEDLAREKIYRKQESQIRDEERNKQRKRNSKNKASDLPANKFCKNVMRDFQKEVSKLYNCRLNKLIALLHSNLIISAVISCISVQEIWSYVARPHANQKSPYKAKFDKAIVARIYDGKLRLKDDLQRPVENRSDFKQSFIDILQECHRDFDHPVVHNGKDSVSLLDVAEQFKRFWAKTEVTQLCFKPMTCIKYAQSCMIQSTIMHN